MGLRYNAPGGIGLINFNPDGSVSTAANAKYGTWAPLAPTSAASGYAISYTIAGVARTVTISFSVDGTHASQNQLIVTILAADNGGAVSTFNFPGYFSSTDSHDLSYTLIDVGSNSDIKASGGGPFQFVITGNFLLSPDLQFLQFAITGTTTVLQIITDNEFSATPGDAANDSRQEGLEIDAVTMNPNPAGKPVSRTAELSFAGLWGVSNNQVVFNAFTEGNASSPDLVLQFAGQYRQVAAALQVIVGAAGSPSVALEIQGEIDTGLGHTGSWSLKLGYSQQTFDLNFDLTNNIVAKDGEFTISTQASIVAQSGHSLSANLELDVLYKLDSSTGAPILKAKVDFQFDSPSNYDLSLEGELDYDGSKLVFDASYKSNGTFSLNLTYTSPSDLQFAIAIVAGKKASDVSITLSFSYKVEFKDGVLQVVRPAASTALVATTAGQAAVPAKT